jgi:hypothetical protein
VFEAASEQVKQNCVLARGELTPPSFEEADEAELRGLQTGNSIRHRQASSACSAARAMLPDRYESIEMLPDHFLTSGLGGFAPKRTHLAPREFAQTRHGTLG